MTLLIANGARDFGRDNLCLKTCSWDEIEDHHIYPKRFLQANGIKGNKANWIVNRTPIRKKTNIKIGANAPHVYFRDSHVIGSTEVSSDLMEEHAIPIDGVLREFSREGYEDFLEARKVGLLIKIEEAVASGVQPDA